MNRLLLLALAGMTSIASTCHAEDWPEFLGPKGTGHYQGAELPIEFGPTKNVTWKMPIPGKAWSSPIIVGGKVYLTTAVPVKTDAGTEHELRALCLNAKTGKTIWDFEIFREAAGDPKSHAKNSHASPTPIFDGKRLYIHFGHLGTAALDPAGQMIWKKVFTYKPVHGNGGSPVLADGKLIFACDGSDQQFTVALDAATGETVWKTDRNHPSVQRRFSFATPAVIKHDGVVQVISPGSDAFHSYDLKTGKELWRVTFIGWSLIVKPVYGEGLVFCSTGYVTPNVLAVRPDGTGDVTKSHVAWTMKRGAPNTPTMILEGKELYVLSDGGFLTCCDAKTGDVHYQERVPGNYSASPILANGLLYLPNEKGQCTIVKVGKTFEVVGKTDMEEPTLASYAAVDGSLYVRTEGHLYRFDKK